MSILQFLPLVDDSITNLVNVRAADASSSGHTGTTVQSAIGYIVGLHFIAQHHPAYHLAWLSNVSLCYRNKENSTSQRSCLWRTETAVEISAWPAAPTKGPHLAGPHFTVYSGHRPSLTIRAIRSMNRRLGLYML